MAKRFIMRIELTADAKKHINGMSDKLGMTQVAMMSRLVQWFGGSGEAVQALVLNQIPGDLRPEVARAVLEQMARQDGGK